MAVASGPGVIRSRAASTRARSVARLTETPDTPGTRSKAFSTRRTQEAQVRPPTPISSAMPGAVPAAGSRVVLAFIAILAHRHAPHAHHRWDCGPGNIRAAGQA